jgi:protein TonB
MILGAFLLGLLVFAFVWRGQERAPAPELAPIAGSGPDFAPLPAPMPADADGASGLEEPDEEALAEQPRLIEAPRPAPPPPREAATPSVRAPSQAATSPVPISQAPPRYPQRAMRRGEEGLVRVKVEVGADGEPTSVTVDTSSQSRELDRAALDAVRRWRFRPAQQDGVAVAGTLIVPIEFKR